MYIHHMVTHYPGQSYTNDEMRTALAPLDEALSDQIVKLGGKHFITERLESDTFFQNLGVERRHIFCDPSNPKEWWEQHAGTDPFALQAALAYEKLMANTAPLTEKDRIIVVGNGVDTTSPHIGYAMMGHLQTRNAGFECPSVLSMVGEGCSGFISALREADLYLRAVPGSRVAIVTVEMMATPLLNPWLQPAVLEHAENATGAEARGMIRRMTGLGIQRYLFGEGCAGALCSSDAQEGSFEFTQFNRWANLMPEDRHLLELVATNTKDQTHYPPFGFFQQDPKRLFNRLLTAYLPPAYAKMGERESRPKHFAVHTGSGTILDFVQTAFGMSDEETEPSRAILREQGNMNGTTGAAVLERLMSQGQTEDVFSVFFGVGFALQTAM